MSSQAMRFARQEQELKGRRFGLWTVLAVVGETKYERCYMYHVLCRCDCGTEKVLVPCNLRTGKTRSCGCAHKKHLSESLRRHGLSKTPEFRIHRGMIARCYDANAPYYRIYGGRGITVCERWLGKDGLMNFVADLGRRPSREYSLDRIDVDGPYTADNCRWATAKEQAKNRRRTHIVEYQGQKRSLTEWAEALGVSYGCLKSRLCAYGWTVEEALTTPSMLGGGSRAYRRGKAVRDGAKSELASKDDRSQE